jgi:hypothetical protein
LQALDSTNDGGFCSSACDIISSGGRITRSKRASSCQRAGIRQSAVYLDDDAIGSDADMLKLLDVLANDVGILGIFADWPATVTYYANCMGLE